MGCEGTYEHLAEGRVGIKEESVLEVKGRILAIVHLVKPGEGSLLSPAFLLLFFLTSTSLF